MFNCEKSDSAVTTKKGTFKLVFDLVSPPLPRETSVHPRNFGPLSRYVICTF